MCGISGVVFCRSVKLGDLSKMNKVVRHRGPDDEGFVIFSKRNFSPLPLGGDDTPQEIFDKNFFYSPKQKFGNFNMSDCILGLGHRRLSIIDLSMLGHQPLCSSDKNLWITFNGEIYNYLELKEELNLIGYHFNTHTDTEVILAAYQHWGEDCLKRFIGMFSFCIFDINKREIFLARDPFGIKPLYYWFSPSGNFHFASEIKQFTVCEGWEARLNKQRAFDFLFFSLTDHTNETMFDGVFSIPPGSFSKIKIEDLIRMTNRTIETTQWYNLQERKFNGTLEEAGKCFRKLFKDAVKLHLRSDVIVGAALSGGLDSSAIVCEVDQLMKTEGTSNKLKTFSSVSKDERYSEKKWIKVVAENTRVEANYIYPSFLDIFRLTPEIIWHQDEPYQSQSAFLGYHVFSKAKELGVKVLLNGQGADEYLSGYTQFRSFRLLQLLKKFKIRKLNDELKYIKEETGISLLKLYVKVLLGVIPTFVRDALRKKNKGLQILQSVFSIEKLGIKGHVPIYNSPIKNNSIKKIAESQLFHAPLQKYLRWEDRNSMAYSIEARVPFLDHRLVEFATSLPADFLDAKGKSKQLLLVGLKELLPLEILNRKDKKGFITPEERWVKEDYTAELRKKIEESIGISKGIINPEALNYFDMVVSGKIKFDYTYWRIIIFAEWIKKFDVKI